MTMQSGRATISLTADANVVVDDLCARFPFSERMDAAKVGIAHAVRAAMTPSGRDRAPGSGTGTTWNVGSFDNDGQLRELVRALYPRVEEDPYVLVEALMNRGLVALREELESRSPESLTALLSPPEDATTR